MSIQEQQTLQEKYYSEAIRYMDNAKECLSKAKRDGKFYQDQKYVRMACGTAYCGLLVALDGFLTLKGVVPAHSSKGGGRTVRKQRKSIEYYQSNITNIDKKMLDYLNNAYKVLHLWGYYDGIESVSIVKDGFDDAYNLIEKIKPQKIKNF